MPAQCSWKSSERPSAIKRIGNPEVLVVTSVPGFRTDSTRSKSLRLISRFSATASTIQSTSPHQPRLSSKLPGVIRRAVAGVKNAAGRAFLRGFESRQHDAIAHARVLQHKPFALFVFVQLRRDNIQQKNKRFPRSRNGPRFAHPWFPRRAPPPFQ